MQEGTNTINALMVRQMTQINGMTQGKHCRAWTSRSANVINFNITTSLVGGTQ
jgi:hypothetical protein